jgi:putative molybdopterin biosynthesis protein
MHNRKNVCEGNMIMIEESYTIAEAARLLKVSKDTIRRMIKEGELESFRVGRQIRIRKDVLDKLMGKK